MQFESYQIKGRGRGKKIGIPTINLQIPPKFSLEEGIFASRVEIEGKRFKGALHFGPVPVFGDIRRSLEVYLLDVFSSDIPDLKNKMLKVEVIKKIRDIQNFPSPEAMVERIKKDVLEIKKALKNPGL